MPVIEAVVRAIGRGALDRERFRLRFLGNVSLSTDLRAECRRLGIDDVVEFVPRVTRVESLRQLKSASALLLVQTGTTVSVPGKAYEYLAAGRPILALSEEGETAELVRASGIGRSVSPSASIEQIESALIEVVSLASTSLPAPPRELYDGVVHARSTVRLLGHYAQHGRGHAVPSSPPARRSARAGTPLEETRR
jgi:glycosyltransferase involved in cell wall biosynthesis